MKRVFARAISVIVFLAMFTWLLHVPAGKKPAFAYTSAPTFTATFGPAQDLGALPGGNNSVANAINKNGVVVGLSDKADGTYDAVLWNNGTIQDLGTLGGTRAEALAVNASGWVVGLSTTSSGATHAFLWKDGGMQDLGTLGGELFYCIGDQ